MQLPMQFEDLIEAELVCKPMIWNGIHQCGSDHQTIFCRYSEGGLFSLMDLKLMKIVRSLEMTFPIKISQIP
jgi:hypothetical protein